VTIYFGGPFVVNKPSLKIKARWPKSKTVDILTTTFVMVWFVGGFLLFLYYINNPFISPPKPPFGF
jgi:hypothetical protein